MSIGEIAGEVSVYIQRLKAHFRVRTDEQLAAHLGMSKQNIANWRRRGAVPEKVSIRLFKQTGILSQAFFENFESVAEGNIVHASVLYSAAAWLKAISRTPTPDEWLLLGEAMEGAIYNLRHRLKQAPRPLDQAAVFQQLATENEGRGAAYSYLAGTMAQGSVMDFDFDFPK